MLNVAKRIYVFPAEYLLTEKHGQPLGHVSNPKADPATSSKPGCASPIVQAQHQGMNTSRKVTCHLFRDIPIWTVFPCLRNGDEDKYLASLSCFFILFHHSNIPTFKIYHTKLKPRYNHHLLFLHPELALPPPTPITINMQTPRHHLILLLTLFGSTTTTFAQVATVNAISQISDGQPQAPTGVPAAASTSSAPYTNGFTSFTTQTNSLGVITGMPSVVTSQPAVVTSQPSVYMWNTTSTAAAGTETLVPAGNSSVAATTLVTSSASATGSFSFGAGPSTSSAAAGSATVGVSTGGAVARSVAGAGVGMGAVGALVAVFL